MARERKRSPSARAMLMKWPDWFLVLGLALLLLLGVSCTAGDGAPTEVSVPAPIESESHGFVSGSVDSIGQAIIKATDLLTCQSQPYVISQKTIGPKGGSLTIGSHQLVIPRGALAANVRITGEQVSGTVNSVRLSPEGLRFSTPARLILSYSNCASVQPPKRMAYTDELLKILELPTSQDDSKHDDVIGAIDHFSRYAVAY